MFQAATKKLRTRLLNVFSQHDTGIATGIIRLSNRTRPTVSLLVQDAATCTLVSIECKLHPD